MMSRQTSQQAVALADEPIGYSVPARSPERSTNRILSAPSRMTTVDLARVLAIMLMVQGHTLDVLLAPTYREGFAFNCWLFLRGLTAPTFLLLSGFSFSVSTARRWDAYLHLSSSLWRRLRRFSSFILLGYAMHLPGRTLHDLRMLDAAGWQSGLQVDVLQCIGLTLIILQLLVMAARTHVRFAIIAGGLAFSIVAFSPLVWAVEWNLHIPHFIAPYFNARTGSLFPLFPWSAYIFAGAAAGGVWVRCQAHRGHLLTRALSFGSPLLVLAGVLLAYVPLSVYGSTEFWTVSPNLFLIRVGCVGLLLGMVAYVERRVRIPGQVVHSLARESLIIYFVHVCVLYGSIWNFGIRHWIGTTLTPLPALGWILLLLTSMILMALAWNKIKREKPSYRWVVVSAMIALTASYSL